MKNEKFRRLMPWIFFGGLGILMLILFAIPYFKSVFSYDFGVWGGGKHTETTLLGGYKLFQLWKAKGAGTASAFFQMFALIDGLLLLVLGVVGILKELKVMKLPDNLGKMSLEKIGDILMMIFIGLNVLVMICLLAFCAQNSHSEYGAFAGYKISAGVFLTLIFSIGAFVALFVLRKKFPLKEAASDGGQPEEEVAEAEIEDEQPAEAKPAKAPKASAPKAEDKPAE